MGQVSNHQLSAFTTPVNGTSPIDANTVRGNDNSIKTSYNAHDADTTIHLQNSAVLSRPGASTAGQMWLTTDTGAVYLYYDTGSTWVEANYLRNTGGTLTGNATITGTLLVGGVATFTSQPILSSLTASLPVFTDGSKGLVSNAMTGTGNVVMSASPTLTGTITAAAITASGLITANAGATVASGQTLTLTGATVAGAPTWSSAQAITISTATQASITTMANLVTVGTLTAGALGSGFGNISIGASSVTAGAASFTTGAFSGVLSVTNTTEATTGPAGAAVISGGLYVAKKVFSIGNLTVGASTFVVTAATGAVQTGNVGVGGAPTTDVAFYVQSTALAGTSQYGIVSLPTFTSATTVEVAAGYFGTKFAAASYTTPTSSALFIAAPTVGASHSITNQYGAQISNQGASGITNAYGIYIAAQSGAATTNIGLYNAGTTTLVGEVNISGILYGLRGSFTNTGATSYAVQGIGRDSSGDSFGLNIDAGTTNADYCALLRSRSGTPYLAVRGDGKVTLDSATTGRATFNIPHGTAPTSPVDGDMWTTTAGLYIRINGSTVGPLS